MIFNVDVINRQTIFKLYFRLIFDWDWTSKRPEIGNPRVRTEVPVRFTYWMRWFFSFLCVSWSAICISFTKEVVLCFDEGGRSFHGVWKSNWGRPQVWSCPVSPDEVANRPIFLSHVSRTASDVLTIAGHHFRRSENTDSRPAFSRSSNRFLYSSQRSHLAHNQLGNRLLLCGFPNYPLSKACAIFLTWAE